MGVGVKLIKTKKSLCCSYLSPQKGGIQNVYFSQITTYHPKEEAEKPAPKCFRSKISITWKIWSHVIWFFGFKTLTRHLLLWGWWGRRSRTGCSPSWRRSPWRPSPPLHPLPHCIPDIRVSLQVNIFLTTKTTFLAWRWILDLKSLKILEYIFASSLNYTSSYSDRKPSTMLIYSVEFLHLMKIINHNLQQIKTYQMLVCRRYLWTTSWSPI